jgi:hypothetical protein
MSFIMMSYGQVLAKGIKVYFDSGSLFSEEELFASSANFCRRMCCGICMRCSKGTLSCSANLTAVSGDICNGFIIKKSPILSQFSPKELYIIESYFLSRSNEEDEDSWRMAGGYDLIKSGKER